MRVDLAFRISNFLTLAVACACLGYAELAFLPALPYVLVPVAGLLVLAFFLEGRWALPNWGANVFAVVVAAGMVAWLVYSCLNDEYFWSSKLLPQVGPLLLTLMVVKLFRPKRYQDYWLLQTIGFLQVTLACVLAKDPLFSVFLFAYLAAGLWCLSLLQLHSGQEACGARSAEREAQDASRSALRVPWRMLGLWLAGRRALVAGVSGFLFFLIVPRQGDVAWDPGALLKTKPPAKLQRGFSTEFDLNRTGPVQMSNDESFTVVVTEKTKDGPPKLDLSREQRWRGLSLDHYDKGRWTVTVPPEMENYRMWRVPRGPWEGMRWPPPELQNPFHRRFLPRNEELPDLGQGQYFLKFTVDRQLLGSLFLADPVIVEKDPDAGPTIPIELAMAAQAVGLPGVGATLWPQASVAGRLAALDPAFLEGGIFPVKVERGDFPRRGFERDFERRFDRPFPRPPYTLFYETDGTLITAPSVRTRSYSYVQVTKRLPASQQDLRPPRWVDRQKFDAAYFNTEPLPQIREWTQRLLHRLVARGRYGLTAKHMQPGPGGTLLQPRNHLVVARALCRYLAISGEFTYSLDLRRKDERLDPTVDFLWNVRSGHCQRFAGALALMLRSVGMPTRVVVGFRGAEHQGEGKYIVRQSQAHSWVEVLVLDPKTGKDAWLTLDPTPAAGGTEPSGAAWSELLAGGIFEFGELWRALILDLNSEQQRTALADLWSQLAPAERATNFGQWIADSYSGRFWTKPGFWLLSLAGGLIVFRLGRFFRFAPRARAAGPAAGVGFYARLLAILARHCRLRPETSQTPREFGEAVRTHLQASPATAPLADLPVWLADRFYQVRFGRLALDAAEGHAIDRQLDELDKVLALGRAAC
jgi:hypothetical protein